MIVDVPVPQIAGTDRWACYDAFATNHARLTRRSCEWLISPAGTAQCAFHDTTKLLKRRTLVAAALVAVVNWLVARHTSGLSVGFSHISFNTPGWDGACGAALGWCCCTARSSLLQVLVVYTSLHYTRHLCIVVSCGGVLWLWCDVACCARAGLRSGLFAATTTPSTPSRTRAARAALREDRMAAGHLLGSSQDTHNLAHFLVCIRDLSLLVVNIALSRCTFVRLLAQFSPGLPQLTIFTWSPTVKGFMFIVGAPGGCFGLLLLGCCAWASSLKVTHRGVSKTYATNGFGTRGSHSTGGFSLFLVFDCGFCFVDVARCVFFC